MYPQCQLAHSYPDCSLQLDLGEREGGGKGGREGRRERGGREREREGGEREGGRGEREGGRDGGRGGEMEGGTERGRESGDMEKILKGRGGVKSWLLIDCGKRNITLNRKKYIFFMNKSREAAVKITDTRGVRISRMRKSI